MQERRVAKRNKSDIVVLEGDKNDMNENGKIDLAKRKRVLRKSKREEKDYMG